MSAGAARAFVLVDLGFGDAGKGLLTDYLVRSTGARLVVRYNGGAQAGHNVVAPDGRHHTFSQWGSGTFVPGVQTFLSRHVVIHPTALLREAAALAANGVPDALARLGISAGALVVTPFQQAAGRLREIARGAGRHGSCGVGIGETVADSLAHPEETIRAGDLRDLPELRRKLTRLRGRKRGEAEALLGAAGCAVSAAAVALERSVFERPELLEGWVKEAARLAALVMPDSTLEGWMAAAGTAVFEGAQGVLLDEWAGFHPYTTWSGCTAINALALLAEAAPAAAVERIGVLRAHAVRHGPGPLPTEAPELRLAVCEHNGFGEWQGEVRYGWFDAVLARYAMDLAGPLDTLALTHLDVPARAGEWQLCDTYQVPSGKEMEGLDDLVAEHAAGLLTRLAPSPARCLARQARLTELLFKVRPSLSPCKTDDEAVIRHTERLLGRGIDLVSRGPRAADVSPRRIPHRPDRKNSLAPAKDSPT